MERFKITASAAKEIRLCQQDFAWFRRHLKILDRETSRVKRFSLNRAQVEMEEFANKHSFRYVLKPRQRGSTTYWIARAFWQSLLRPNHRSLIVLHTHDAALKVFQMVERFYDNLPDLLRFPTTKRANNEIVFHHGGTLRVTSAESSSARSSTNNSILMSEFAHYEHASETIAAIMQTLTEDGEATLETTANGLNHAHRMWYDPEAGFSKCFLSWRGDPDCRDKELAPGLNLSQWVKDFAEENGLDSEQTNWAQRTFSVKCHNNPRIFPQEYPLTADMAFQATGSRVFPHLTYTTAALKINDGYIDCLDPNASRSKIGRCVVLGVDTANGNPTGDASALCAIDVANRKNPVLLETYLGHLPIPDFAKVAFDMGKKWDAFAVVETNGIGQGTLDVMRQLGYGKFYRRVSYMKLEDRWQETLGFVMGGGSDGTRSLLTNKLHTYIGERQLVGVHREPRLQAQIQAWQYDDNNRPTHPPGQHDDLLIACGLALMGMDEIGEMELQSSTYAKRPYGMEQILAWEHAANTVYTGMEQFEDDPDDRGREPLQDLSSVLRGKGW